MALLLFSVNHAEHGLSAVEAAAPTAVGLAAHLVEAGMRGCVTVATCNRMELYIDVAGSLTEAESLVAAHLTGAAPRVAHNADVVRHLFRVAAGLDSMVLGEREVAGQLRAALKQAQAEGTTSWALTEAFEHALKTSRAVATHTRLGGLGRSLVSVGLDQIAALGPQTRMLLWGTGSYAGASVAAAQERGVGHIGVHSASGRAPGFAQGHGCTPLTNDDLPRALAEADVVVACRGRGGTVLSVADVAAAMAERPERPLTIVDLSLVHDVETHVTDMPSVTYLDLERIGSLVPDVDRAELAQARSLVDAGLHQFMINLDAKRMDPAVVALRAHVQAAVDDEIARLGDGDMVSAEAAAHALKRLAARLVHVPSVRAREAAEQGLSAEYLSGLRAVHGIDAPLADHPAFDSLHPDDLEAARCPHTGMTLGDLGNQEAS